MSRPSDTALIDYLASYWDSQAVAPQPVLAGRPILNPTGSFRDAVAADMRARQRVKAFDASLKKSCSARQKPLDKRAAPVA